MRTSWLEGPEFDRWRQRLMNAVTPTQFANLFAEFEQMCFPDLAAIPLVGTSPAATHLGTWVGGGS